MLALSSRTFEIGSKKKRRHKWAKYGDNEIWPKTSYLLVLFMVRPSEWGEACMSRVREAGESCLTFYARSMYNNVNKCSIASKRANNICRLDQLSFYFIYQIIRIKWNEIYAKFMAKGIFRALKYICISQLDRKQVKFMLLRLHQYGILNDLAALS